MDIGLSNPFNFTGSKHRYLSELKEILPVDNNLTVIDPFFGGGDLSMHLNKTWAIDAIDSCKQLIEMHHDIKTGHLTPEKIIATCADNQLSKNGRSEYYTFRDKYNKNQNSIDLYALICHANSNRMRFSQSKDEFNMSGGVPYRYFNANMIDKLHDYINRVAERDVSFYCHSAFDFNFGLYDIALIDPPYSNTTATYNQTGVWGVEQDKVLLDKIKRECNKFVLFGQSWSKGIENKLISEFANKYNFKVLKSKKAVAHNRKDLKTVDVMIWN